MSSASRFKKSTSSGLTHNNPYLRTAILCGWPFLPDSRTAIPCEWSFFALRDCFLAAGWSGANDWLFHG
jgi:hypothetical protein